MTPNVRLWIVGVFSACLAIALGYGIAEESFTLAGLVTLVIFWMGAEWLRGPLPEAWVLAFVVGGYILGNRGFAQVQATESLPLFPAEIALGVCVPVLLIRAALHTMGEIRWRALHWMVLAWAVLGASRLPLDFRQSRLMALRDFAMVYYATFFLVAQMLGTHPDSRRLLHRALTWAFGLLPVVTILYQVSPDFFLDHIRLRGTPLIYYKSDLVAAFLAGGFFWMWTCWEQTQRRLYAMLAAANLLLIAAMGSPRAAMVAVAGTTVFWLVARRFRLLGFQLGAIALAVAIAVPFTVFTSRDLRHTKIYSTYEHALSIFDFAGTGSYLHAESGDPGDNNRFRIVWWKSVATETVDQNIFFGLGFGYDLAARFLADYDWLTNEEFSARSPHSMIMSVFGRMGIVGLLLWLAQMVLMLRASLRTFRERRIEAMGLWSVAWVLWMSGCFGVVLEGPMGAVVFWTSLGLAVIASEEPINEHPDGNPLSLEPPVLDKEVATVS